MGVVYRARDESTRDLCALKIITPEHLAKPESALRFRREFRAMQKVQHPNVVRVQTSGAHDGRPFFTMEIVEGRDIKSWLDGDVPIVPEVRGQPPAGPYSAEQVTRLNDPLRLRRLAEAIVQVSFALSSIHAHRIVHRDLKPDNILVSDAGVVKLMDFGIAKSFTGRSEHSSGGMVLGTFKYISPEQAMGLNEVDGRADLYCLGIILYELLAGRHPFYSETSIGYAYHHARKKPPAITTFNPDVDPALAGIALKLLRKDPNQRFATADDVITAIREAVDGIQEQSQRLQAAPDDEGPAELFAPGHIGRARETGALVGMAQRIKAQQGRVIVISGPHRIGKTRLLREAAGQARALGVDFLLGQPDPDGGAPFHPYVSMLDRVVADMHAEHPDGLLNLLGEDAPVLARYLPSIEALGSTKNTKAVSALEPDAERLRFIDATRGFLRRLSRLTPRVVVLENIERADELSLELTAHLMAEGLSKGKSATDGAPISIVLTVDPDGLRGRVDASNLLAEAKSRYAARTMTLKPLGPAAVRELFMTMIGGGEVADVVGDVLHQESEGVPGAVEARVRAWADAGALRKKGGSWVLVRDDKGPPTQTGAQKPAAVQVGAATRADIPVPESAEHRAQRLLDPLDVDARIIAQRAAVFGEQVAAPALEGLASLPDDRFLDGLNSLLGRGVLLEGEQGGYRFASPELREEILLTLNDEERKRIHQGVARLLRHEQERDQRAVDPERLAQHHLEGGEPLRALGQLMQAARQALATSATKIAADRVRRAQELFLRECAHASSDPVVARRDADLVLLRLDVLAQVGEHEECIALATRRLPRLKGTVDARVVAEVLLRVAASERAVGRLDDAAEHAGEALRITERHAFRGLRCRVKALFGSIYAQRGDAARSDRYWEEALELAETLGDAIERDRARAALAYRAVDAGNLDHAEHEFEALLASAKRRSERLREPEYVNSLGLVAHERGDRRAADARYRDAIRLAKHVGNRRVVGVGLANLGLLFAEAGRRDNAIAFASRARRVLDALGDHTMLSYVAIVEAQAHLVAGRPRDALRAAEGAVDLAKKSGSARYEAEALICRGLARAKTGGDGSKDIERGRDLAEDARLNRSIAFAYYAEGELAKDRRDTAQVQISVAAGLKVATPRFRKRLLGVAHDANITVEG